MIRLVIVYYHDSFLLLKSFLRYLLWRGDRDIHVIIICLSISKLKLKNYMAIWKKLISVIKEDANLSRIRFLGGYHSHKNQHLNPMGEEIIGDCPTCNGEVKLKNDEDGPDAHDLFTDFSEYLENRIWIVNSKYWVTILFYVYTMSTIL